MEMDAICFRPSGRPKPCTVLKPIEDLTDFLPNFSDSDTGFNFFAALNGKQIYYEVAQLRSCRLLITGLASSIPTPSCLHVNLGQDAGGGKSCAFSILDKWWRQEGCKSLPT